MFRVEMLKQAAKRLDKQVPARVQDGVKGALAQIAADPYMTRPDKPGKWDEVWTDAPNHRHLDLAEGWRLCYTVMHDETGEVFVLVLFIGTHREYEKRYGFKER